MTARITQIICPSPRLPEIATRALASASRSVVLELAYAINSDRELSRRVVDAIAGTRFAAGRHVTTVAEAALEYPQGFRKLAMTLIVRDELYGATGGSTELDRAEFWRHSLGTALAAENLARRLRVPGPDRAYTAGLLHDVGLAALHRNAPKRLDRLVQEVAASGDPIQVELTLHGTTHCQIGAGIAQEWGLDESVVDAIAHHHQPQQAGRNHVVLANVVYLADVLTSPEHPSCYAAAPMDVVAMQGLGLEEAGLRDVARETEADLRQLERLLDVS